MKKDSKRKKTHRLRRLVDRFNLSLLFRKIESYGYKYSFGSFALQTLFSFGVVGIVSYVCRLHMEYIAVLMALTLIAMPLIVSAQFDQLYQIKRFQMVISYLENVLPVFKNKPIVTNAWQQILDLLDGEMKEAVQEALEYVMTNTEDADPYMSAFEIIESHFPNSRIHAAHQMMYTIMTENSKDYYEAVDNMYYDISNWINRSYDFQKEIRHRKFLLILICVLTLLLNCWFVIVYVASRVFENFTELLPYQISSAVFIGILLLVMAVFYVTINAKWLVDDQTNKIMDKYQHDFEKLIATKDTRVTLVQTLIAIVFLLLGVYIYIERNDTFTALLCLLACVMMLVQNRRMYQKRKKSAKKALEIEFPMFLRDVSLNLHNLTALNAIENSRKIASPILDYYIERFLKDASEDPSSIVPYNNFLGEFDLPDVRSAMKVLYTFQTLNREQIQQQSNSLIIRNQEMLAKSEKLRNKDEMTGMEMLAFIPVGMFIIQTLINMAILLYYMLVVVSSSIY